MFEMNLGTSPSMQRRLLSFLIASVALLLVGLTPYPVTRAVYADSSASPAVFLPGSSPYGVSYKEWSARWWQWGLSIPTSTNPILDDSGDFCNQHQSGQVWYLAGDFGGSVTRSCTIPAGKSILFPLLNAAFGAAVGDCTRPADCDVNKLRQGAGATVRDAQLLAATLDQVAVPNLVDYRAKSPVFSISLPDDSLVGLPAGTYRPNVSDGYWVMLQPLPAGAHELNFHAISNSGFELNVTYHLTVN